MASEWYVSTPEGHKGPLSAQQIEQLASEGKLLPDMFVRKGPEGQWVQARSVKGLSFPAVVAEPSGDSAGAVEETPKTPQNGANSRAADDEDETRGPFPEISTADHDKAGRKGISSVRGSARRTLRHRNFQLGMYIVGGVAIVGLVILIAKRCVKDNDDKGNRKPPPKLVIENWPKEERAGAKVYIDEDEHDVPRSGTIEFVVEEGTHDIRAFRPGFKEQEKEERSFPSGSIVRFQLDPWKPRVARPAPVPPAPHRYAESTEEAKDAVVKFTIKRRDGQGVGAGFFIYISPKPDYLKEPFLVVTNYHVVKDATAASFAVLKDNTQHRLAGVYAIPDQDLALVKLATLPYMVTALEICTVDPQAGDLVQAIGHPDNKSFMVTGGTIGRRIMFRDLIRENPNCIRLIDDPNPYWEMDLIDHDATLRPGSSGGPLVDKLFRVLGVNTARITEFGIAIPGLPSLRATAASLEAEDFKPPQPAGP